MSLSAKIMRSGVAAIRYVSPELTALRAPTGGAIAVTARRSMTSFQERERGEETVYMRREDKKLLEKLLKKEKAVLSKDGREELMEILGKNKLPDEVVDNILRWKST